MLQNEIGFEYIIISYGTKEPIMPVNLEETFIKQYEYFINLTMWQFILEAHENSMDSFSKRYPCLKTRD